MRKKNRRQTHGGIDQSILAPVAGRMFAAALGASVASVLESEAAVIYSGIQDIYAADVDPLDGLYSEVDIDIDGNGVDDFRLVAGAFQIAPFEIANVGLTGLGYNQVQSVQSGLLSNGLIAPLDPGDLIDAAQPFDVGGNLADGLYNTAFQIDYGFNIWNPGDTGFVGLEFRDAADNAHYAWIRMELVEFEYTDGSPRAVVRVVDWAYESSINTEIVAGTIPEPSSLSMLAMGAAGLHVLRRRKRPATGQAAS